ncbi:MAG: hypothetical protein R3C01_12370 [Planctomycetaceae bacterium]
MDAEPPFALLLETMLIGGGPVTQSFAVINASTARIVTMKALLSTTVSAFAFATLGLIAAFGIAMFAPTPPSQRPDFERTMFIVLPLAGSAIGWFIAYLATPFDNEQSKPPTAVRISKDQQHNAA